MNVPDSDNPAAGVAVQALHGQTMGTSWSVQLVASRGTDLRALHDGVQGCLDRLVAQMSTWEAESDISRYNRSPAGEWWPLQDEFRHVLRAALEIASASGGAYDPTISPLVAAWGFGAHGGARTVPSPERLQAARARVGWQRVVMDPAGSRVRQPGGVELDLSAIAKGHGVDAVAAFLRRRGIDNALVEVGGELFGHGRKPDGQPWRVLVESSPEEEADSDELEPRVLVLDGIAVATSGDRWHAFEHDGHRYSHTIDPRSGQPVTEASAAVTVVAEDAMHADAWATALTVMGAQAGHAFALRHGLAARFLARAPQGLRETMTPAFERHLHA
ncbi:FAD:protein FMN transferase [Pseudoxanthomonas putridarboris]|uniref:FAD:protein FMN transferase n=1 Tax=Pseudoxanthomonas putridarboris TaxID=752605 RepID=A0ABU9IXH2_9GAMM